MGPKIWRCPGCSAEVIAQGVIDFRCPVCGQTCGNQLSLFNVGRDDDGTIKEIGPLDTDAIALAAQLYHELPGRASR